MLKQKFMLIHELFGSQLNILIKKVHFEQLFTVVPKIKKKPVNHEENPDIHGGEKVSHGSESDISRIIIVIISVEEQVETESHSLEHEFRVLDHGVGHVVVPFRCKLIFILRILRSLGLSWKASMGTLGARDRDT